MIRAASDVSWVVQADRLVVFKGGKQETLLYPEAAVWDLLTRNPRSAVIRKITYIAGLDLAAADRLVEASVNGWIERGLLIREDGNG